MNLLRKLNVSDIDNPGDVSMIFAVGKARSPIGLVRDLFVQINELVKDKITAYVYETNGQY